MAAVAARDAVQIGMPVRSIGRLTGAASPQAGKDQMIGKPSYFREFPVFISTVECT